MDTDVQDYRQPEQFPRDAQVPKWRNQLLPDPPTIHPADRQCPSGVPEGYAWSDCM